MIKRLFPTIAEWGSGKWMMVPFVVLVLFSLGVGIGAVIQQG